MKTIDKIEGITELLFAVGKTTESARRQNRPLTAFEREAIFAVRREARQRLSQQMINTIEAQGAEAVRS